MRPPDAKVLLAGAESLGVTLSDDSVAQLMTYLEMLSKWNRVYNLTAVRDPSEMLVQHLLDSVAAVQPLLRQFGNKPMRALDVGSGAGLPGVVLAALLPSLDVTCVDAVGKKAAFVRQVAAELPLGNLHSVHARVEDIAPSPFDVITSRAFASLDEFVSLTWRHHGAGTIWMAMKGKTPTSEISALPSSVEVFHVEQLAIPGLAAKRCLIWIREKP